MTHTTLEPTVLLLFPIFKQFLSANILKAGEYQSMKLKTWYQENMRFEEGTRQNSSDSCAPNTSNIQTTFKR